MAVVFERPKSLIDVPTHYCPGCTHGIVHRILCEVIDEMGIVTIMASVVNADPMRFIKLFFNMIPS